MAKGADKDIDLMVVRGYRCNIRGVLSPTLDFFLEVRIGPEVP